MHGVLAASFDFAQQRGTVRDIIHLRVRLGGLLLDALAMFASDALSVGLWESFVPPRIRLHHAIDLSRFMLCWFGCEVNLCDYLAFSELVLLLLWGRGKKLKFYCNLKVIILAKREKLIESRRDGCGRVYAGALRTPGRHKDELGCIASGL